MTLHLGRIQAVEPRGSLLSKGGILYAPSYLRLLISILAHM